VAAGSTCIQHMQKALTQMNVQLANVISDISGVTGMAILRAIAAGEHDPQKLSTLKHNRVRASREQIAQSLEGNWRDELLFVLEQSLELYDVYVRKIAACDQRIELHLKTMTSKLAPEHQSTLGTPPSPKNEPQFNLKDHLCRITGVDLTRTWRPGGANGADYHFRSWSGHEPLEHRETVRLVAWAVSGQPD
jgi:transposase